MGEWKLTEEGKRCMASGWPEANLMEYLHRQYSKNPAPVEDVRKALRDFGRGVQWAKKNGWIAIKHGKIVQKDAMSEHPPEWDALKTISSGGPVSDNELKILINRQLISRETHADQKARELEGRTITVLTPGLLKTGAWKKMTIAPYNVAAGAARIYPGKRQPYSHFLQQARRKFVELGFKEMHGPAIETEFWNFDALYQAQNHPSRDWTQTYSLKYPKHGSLPDRKTVSQVKASHENGWRTGSRGWGYRWDPAKARSLMPRAHSTACSARQLAKGVEIPGKYFAIKRCFRPDVIDATHGVEFNQTDGIVIDPSLTFRSLLGLLKQFAVEFAGAEKVRFFPDYYPFTEPSVQLSARHPEMGWVEFAGAGIFRPEVTEPLGVKEPVIAWGMGIDRLAMFKLGINDIRELFSKNLDWIREKEVMM